MIRVDTLRRRYGLLLSAILMTGCASSAYVHPLNSESADKYQEYAVYAAVIESLYTGDSVNVIIIEDETLSLNLISKEWDETIIYLNREIPLTLPETFKDFQSKNRQSHPLEPALMLNPKYQLISREASSQIDREGWVNFYERYPQAQGLMRLSRVGFSHDMKQALVYVHNQKSYNVGKGFYVLLVKENNGWSVKYKYQWSNS